MGLLEEAAAAVEGLKHLDPNASLLTAGVAAIAGFAGAKRLTEHLKDKAAEPAEATPNATPPA